MITKTVVATTKNIKSGLSAREATVLARLSEEEKRIITIRDIAKELNSDTYAKVLVSRLVKKRWLLRLAKGKYLIVPLDAGIGSQWTAHGFNVASKIVEPSYVSYWSALNFYGWTEQVPFTVFSATIRKTQRRNLMNMEFMFQNIGKRKFFGFVRLRNADGEFLISEKEKAIVDSLEYPENCGGISEVIKSVYNARAEILFEKLVKYAKKAGNGVVFKRLGYILETLKIGTGPEIIAEIRKGVTEGYSPLDPTKESKGEHISKWNLIINIPERIAFGVIHDIS